MNHTLKYYSLFYLTTFFSILSCSSPKPNSADLIYNQEKEITAQKEDTFSCFHPAGAYANSDYARFNCQSCHTYEKKLVGPALGKSFEKITPEWLVTFINHPDSLLQTSDAVVLTIKKSNPSSIHFNVNTFQPLTLPKAREMMGHD